jgi:hypothetical protein
MAREFYTNWQALLSRGEDARFPETAAHLFD